MELTSKQIRFCEEYLIDLNATRAAIRAGYSQKTANEQGPRLLVNVSIQERIQQLKNARSERTEITADRVLEELAVIGFSKITDFLQVSEVEIEVPKVNPFEDDGEDDEDGLPAVTEKRIVKVVDIFATDKVKKESIGAIASIKQGRGGIELKLHDKVKALEDIGEHLGMFTKKIEHSGAIDTGLSLADLPDDLARQVYEHKRKTANG